MNRIPIFQVDAFTSELFGGNPAAICPLQSWPDDAVLQSIAAENNLAETAFFIPGGTRGEDYALRWFTPSVEARLCGHATLASAYIIFEKLNPSLKSVSFSSLSGRLDVSRADDGMLVLDFPALPPATVDMPAGLQSALGLEVLEFYRAQEDVGNNMAVVAREADVQNLDPDLGFIAEMTGDGLIVTAPAKKKGDAPECDFVSRYFAPNAGIPEDPVTGSAHCVLMPYWAERLGSPILSARQISKRGGDLQCELDGDRVRIGGRAVLYLEGEIIVP